MKLKKVTALVLIVTMISANFSRLFVYAGFELNKNYIATKLCENRNKPWMHCNGKCYFMKKIKQAQEHDKNEERMAQKNLLQDALFTQKTEVKFYSRVLQVMQVPNPRVSLPSIVLPVFQPPQLG
jgi:hypothetical protein